MIKEEEYSEHDLREEIIGDSESGSDGDSSNGGEQFMQEDNLPHSIGTAQGYRSDQAVYAPSGHPTLGRQSDRRRAEDPRPSEPLFYSPRQHFKKVSEITSTRSDTEGYRFNFGKGVQWSVQSCWGTNMLPTQTLRYPVSTSAFEQPALPSAFSKFASASLADRTASRGQLGKKLVPQYHSARNGSLTGHSFNICSGPFANSTEYMAFEHENRFNSREGFDTAQMAQKEKKGSKFRSTNIEQGKEHRLGSLAQLNPKRENEEAKGGAGFEESRGMSSNFSSIPREDPAFDAHNYITDLGLNSGRPAGHLVSGSQPNFGAGYSAMDQSQFSSKHALLKKSRLSAASKEEISLLIQEFLALDPKNFERSEKFIMKMDSKIASIFNEESGINLVSKIIESSSPV